jgi:DNA-binding FadR family transcriptional regulator
MLEVRLMLEGQAAALAAERGSDDAIAAIAGAIDAMRDASRTLPEQVQNDLDFHLRVAEASQNVVLVALVHAIRGLLLGTITATFAANPTISERIDAHALILAGIRARDPAAAQAAMRAHLLLTEELIHRIATIPHASGKEE